MERIFEFSGNHPFLVTALVVMILLVAFHEFRRRAQGASSVTTADAVRLINRGAVVVDVRDAAAFTAGHIVNARHHPAASLKDNPESLAKLRKKTLLLVCDNATISGRAAGELRQQGFEQVFNLRGGLSAWRQENLPLVKDQDKPSGKSQDKGKSRPKGGGKRGGNGGGKQRQPAREGAEPGDNTPDETPKSAGDKDAAA
ncbi:MAG: rhodanese-like domain-containing protein [Gammaproteobacteria bacterium]|nr:rhodanese-like domain-containing protein [Gammaproteobacteria bacterium]